MRCRWHDLGSFRLRGYHTTEDYLCCAASAAVDPERGAWRWRVWSDPDATELRPCAEGLADTLAQAQRDAERAHETLTTRGAP